MAPRTFSFTVQLHNDGSLDVHSWEAHYKNGGRQLPSHRLTAHDVDAAYLQYLANELVDEVVRTRAREASREQPPLPL